MHGQTRLVMSTAPYKGDPPDERTESSSNWALTGQWKTVTGMLVTDGTEDSIAVAPYDPGNRSDYAVEAEIQALKTSSLGSGFYLMARLISGTGYWGGHFEWGDDVGMVGTQCSRYQC